jgi:hypothetical protein
MDINTQHTTPYHPHKNYSRSSNQEKKTNVKKKKSVIPFAIPIYKPQTTPGFSKPHNFIQQHIRFSLKKKKKKKKRRLMVTTSLQLSEMTASLASSDLSGNFSGLTVSGFLVGESGSEACVFGC